MASDEKDFILDQTGSSRNEPVHCGLHEASLLGVALVSMSLLTCYMATRSGPLFDEPAHLASGIMLANASDPGYFKVNPPANKWVTALLAEFFDVELSAVMPSSAFANSARPEFALGDAILADTPPGSYFHALRLARFARVPFLLLGAWMLWQTMKHQAPWRRVLVVWLWCFSPLMLGHGWVVSADALAGVAMCFILLTARPLWQTSDWANFAVSGSAWGLAIGTKFTFAPLYLGFIPAVEAARYIAGANTQLGKVRKTESTAVPSRSRRIGRWLGLWIVHALVACLTLNTLYLFEGTGKQLGQHDFISRLFRPFGSHSSSLNTPPSALESTLAHLPSPFPESFLEGIDQQLADMDHPRGAYLMGERLEGKLPWFFLVGYWIKEQLAVMLALAMIAAAAIAESFRRSTRSDPSELRVEDLASQSVDQRSNLEQPVADRNPGPTCRTKELSPADAALILFCIAMLIVFSTLMATQDNLVWNMRYLIPALPLIYILLAMHSPEWRLKMGKQFMRRVPVSCTILMILMLVEFAYVAPFHFSYSNPLFGGSHRIPIALNDSNFDYGQDVLYIRRWHEKQLATASAHGDEIKSYGVLSGHGRFWLKDIYSPPSLKMLQQALAERKTSPRAESSTPALHHQDNEQHPITWLLVSRGLNHPEPWAVRYSTYTDARLSQPAQAIIRELLEQSPDVWITPVIVGYQIGH